MLAIELDASRMMTRSRQVRCEICKRSQACSAADLMRFAREGWPRCCHEVMALFSVTTQTDTGTVAEKRISRRRPARSGARAEVRKGVLGLGSDLGSELIDVSEDGLCVKLKAPLDAKQEVEVILRGPGVGKATKCTAEVCWCRPEPAGMYQVGLRLRSRLSYAILTDLAR